ncbi:Metalloprotease [Atractiella rhizophila]|nr:Metalloprotease [Atractiella rhizophila]
MANQPSPPQAPPRWNHSVDEIEKLASEVISKSTATLDKIASLKPEDCTFSSVVLPLAFDQAELESKLCPLDFYQNVSESEEIRDASTEVERKIRDHELVSTLRKDVYRALKNAEKNTDVEKLDKESSRLMEKLLLERKRMGLDLEDEQLEKLKTLQKELNELELQTRKNYNEENGFSLFTKEELAGVPDYAIQGFDKVADGGVEKLKVTNKTTDQLAVMSNCRIPATRKHAFMTYENRLAANCPIAEKIFKLRREVASLLGYETHAHFVLEEKMAKHPDAVHSFLHDLKKRLLPLGAEEKKVLLKLKEEEYKENGWQFDGKMYSWDWRYYAKLNLKKSLDLDENLIQEYFPVLKVVPKILEMYQTMLGVRFFEIAADTPGRIWQKDVLAYEVWDSASTGKGEFLGYLYLDLYPRPNKYPHAAVFQITPGFEKQDGSLNHVVTAQVANLAKPSGDKPALMKHDDVVTFFHEMGHAFHNLCSRTKYAKFQGCRTVMDFVEAPSQMLENWCWSKKELKMMSSHYETGEPLPDEQIEKLLKSRKIGQALMNLRQLSFGLFDMRIHSDYSVSDFAELWDSLRNELCLQDNSDRTAGFGSFLHVIGGGYDVGYYGYLYSQVFSTDMFQAVFSSNPMDPEKGKHYRREILLPGSSRDEMESLKAFLGREPSAEAFIKSLLPDEAPKEPVSHL